MRQTMTVFWKAWIKTAEAMLKVGGVR